MAGVDGCGGDGKAVVDGASTTTSWACAGGTTVAMRVSTAAATSGRGRGARRVPDGFDAARVIADFFAAHARD